MVYSIVTRRTEVTRREDWEARLRQALPKIAEVLQKQPGFVSSQYLWGVDDDGEMAHITTWQTVEDCRRYVREGGAATVAAFEDQALPTASHPHGTWYRKSFVVAEELAA